jgi:hypothetical protein
MSIKHDFEDIDFTSICIGFLWGALACCLIAMCVSCTKTEYITVEKVRTDTTYITKHQRDSIWLHDSIWVTQYQKGDTIFLTSRKWHTKYIESIKHDTTYVATHDTIPQPYPVIKEVEKKLSRRQQIVMSVGSMAIMAALIWFLWWAVKILRRYGILKI